MASLTPIEMAESISAMPGEMSASEQAALFGYLAELWARRYSRLDRATWNAVVEAEVSRQTGATLSDLSPSVILVLDRCYNASLGIQEVVAVIRSNSNLWN